MHDAIRLTADPDTGGGLIIGTDWIHDNLMAIGVIIGTIVGLTMLMRANRSQSGENLVTLGNIVLAGLAATAFGAIVLAAPALLGNFFPALK